MNRNNTAARIKGLIVFCGVSGSGKSALGNAVADALNIPFLEGDGYHPPENRKKMESGIPLNDADRSGWLQQLNRAAKTTLECRPAAVMACSALKEPYRREIAQGLKQEPCWFFLHGPRDLILERIKCRQGHFFPPALLDSQLETQEIPDYAKILDLKLPLSTLRDQACEILGARS